MFVYLHKCFRACPLAYTSVGVCVPLIAFAFQHITGIGMQTTTEMLASIAYYPYRIMPLYTFSHTSLPQLFKLLHGVNVKFVLGFWFGRLKWAREDGQLNILQLFGHLWMAEVFV